MSPTSFRSATTSLMNAGTTSWVATSAATTTKSCSGDSARPWQATGPGGDKSIRDVERVKAQAGIWGVQNQMASLAGGFGSFAKPTAQSVRWRELCTRRGGRPASKRKGTASRIVLPQSGPMLLELTAQILGALSRMQWRTEAKFVTIQIVVLDLEVLPKGNEDVQHKASGSDFSMGDPQR
ncbi:hypothetical protein BGW80DRAFT_1448768 [Lactifluus volemus]|nr:hypothetical protein BGW80DRAFT_1448768 [Lactifluus volemus]